MTGDEALPRKNGELVFNEPWEGRAFGLAAALTEGGVYDWADFRDKLVEVTAANEKHGEQTGYYQRWFRALERLALDADSSRQRSWTRGPRHCLLTGTAATSTRLRFKAPLPSRL